MGTPAAALRWVYSVSTLVLISLQAVWSHFDPIVVTTRPPAAAASLVVGVLLLLARRPEIRYLTVFMT